MTTLWADGFDSNSTTDLAYDYTGSPAQLTFVAGRRSSGYAVRTTSYAYNLVRALATGKSTLFISVAMRITTDAGASSQEFLQFLEGATNHVTLRLNSSRQIESCRGLSTVLGTSSALPSAVWCWFQVKIVVHDTAGVVEIRDSTGAVLLNLTGVDTRNAGSTGLINTIKIGPTETSPSYRLEFDDLHIWDDTGSVCNTFTTETRVDALRPSGAGDVTQFTPSTGANYTCVDEVAASTTDYVESATAAQQDLYAFTDLPHTPVNIYGVLRTAVATKDDVGTRSIKLLTKCASAVSAGADKALSFGSYVRLADTIDVYPNTSVAWTTSALNASQFGFENV